MPKQDIKQQSHNDKQKIPSKKFCKNSKGESSSTTTNASIEEKLNEFERKNIEEYYKYKQSVCSDADEKDKSVNNDPWPMGTTAIVGDSILNGIVGENLCGQGRLFKIKRFPGSTADDLSHHIIPKIQKKPTNVIIDIGTNDVPSLTSREIQNETKIFS